MGDELQRVMQERVARMRQQALRGRAGPAPGIVRTTGTPSPAFTPSIPAKASGNDEDVPKRQAPQGLVDPSASTTGPPRLFSAAQSTSNTNNGHRVNNSRDSSSDDEGAVRLRETLQQMGISETVTPLGPQGSSDFLISSARAAPKLDISDKRSFLGRAPPKVGMIYCHIIRDRSGMKKLHPEYSLYLESGSEEPQFLLAARKRKKNKTSNYLISMDLNDLQRNSGNFYGKVRSNFLGTEFTVYDKGEKPSREGGLALRQELAAVCFESTLVGSKGPRRMVVIIPKVDAAGKRANWKPDTEDSESLINAYKCNERRDEMTILENKKPSWCEEHHAYVLNFKGRVTVASVKNFQLVEKNVAEQVLVQFGKTGTDKFTLDFQHPINGLQAFAMALTAFDNKLACE
ncbi:Tubby protein-like protein 1 [Diplonema papillatum]|nr:Tubby protein-like protein 1 [Diplonema papillatum]